ncbi:SRPBCC domain-containing protein [Myxococcus fulvus]|uniref:SRPBCC domain-containing protein n=1 Tax=Myxococcus TaxID=32 RepID=UPI0020BFC750|nr:SRPBCC domain-containing protein [Myxococcus fulvus]MCK8501496.1 SRPBCC domain-containing protein [Myxococcus fulvus]
MFQLRTEAFIDASPDAVWAVLCDFQAYPLWNPLMLEAHGRVEVGARVAMKARSPDGSGRVFGFRATLTRVEPPMRLEWTGGVPGLMFGRHGFELRPEGSGTRLVHGEDFSGVVTWFMGRPRRDAFRAAYEVMNRALAERVRALSTPA